MSPPLSRRHALKWLAGSAAGTAAAPALAAPHETESAPPSYPRRYPLHDPDYSKVAPYDFPWEKQLSAEELATSMTLADILLPKDETSPAASEVGVHDFINEWVSAPYDKNREDSEAIRGGLGWLNTECFKRFGKAFTELSENDQLSIVDDICDEVKAKPAHSVGARFFKDFRQLCLSGYYTHSATWKSLGYLGNISVGGPYPGVPQELIEKLQLQDVA
jgi:Gluconate 2-dehydrogenase subunit 3